MNMSEAKAMGEVYSYISFKDDITFIETHKYNLQKYFFSNKLREFPNYVRVLVVIMGYI